ncbi:MAG: hypothetical protein ACLU4Q_06060 [Streptococcus thermophilus]
MVLKITRTADGASSQPDNTVMIGWSTKFPDQERPNINGQLNTMDGQYVPQIPN